MPNLEVVSRPTHKQLPTFMVDVNDRFGMSTLTDKSFKHNHFNETDYLPLNSTLKGVTLPYSSNFKTRVMMKTQNLTAQSSKKQEKGTAI